MQRLEIARFVLFIATVTVVYFLAARTLVQLVLWRLGRITLPDGRASRLARALILGMAALGTLCIAYGSFIEPYWPAVTHVRLTTPKLAKGARPLRVVHISDIHSDAKARLEGRLPGLIAAERPDLIVFTGDAINSPEGLPNFRQLMTRLAAIAPTYAVRGNWDVWYWSDYDLFGGTGVHELKSTAEKVMVGTTPVWVAGVPVDRESQIGRLLDAIPSADFSIFLHHYPDEIYEAAKHRPDLYCAGHIHGGQVAVPFYGALLTFARFGKRFEAGLYRVEQTWLYVSRGIGMEGGRMPRVRFCARPEIAVFEIGPAP